MGIEQDSDLRSALDRVGGTVSYVGSLMQLRQDDYHFVVCESGSLGAVSVAPHINVLEFLVKRARTPMSPNAWRLPDYTLPTFPLLIKGGDRAERFEVGEGASSRGLQNLVNDTIIARVPLGGEYDVVVVGESQSGHIEPLAREVNGKALGVIRSTWNRASEWWVLPYVTTNRGAWLAAAFASWKSKRPEDFPPDGFGTLERWMTHAELEATAALAAHEAETAAYLAVRQSELDELEVAASEAAGAAEVAERMLLQAQGDELVAAVSDCLEALGFAVHDSDADAALNKAAKREDLQVRTEVDAEWLALAEVKGYTNRNAKTNDIAQLARAVGFFESRTGTVPKAQWYIVNAQFALPPDERPAPLASSPEDVEAFAEDGGLVIDTRELFKLLRLVQGGAVSKREAQAELVEATSRYECVLERGANSDTDPGASAVQLGKKLAESVG